MYLTFFPEFLHLEKLRNIGIDIQHPNCDKMEDSDNPHLMVIYEHNLKLFFDPITPPSLDVVHRIQELGFNLIHTGRDRLVFCHKDAELQKQIFVI